nr:MAG TPA: hypothetical protein [Caudoviricetes sp.]
MRSNCARNALFVKGFARLSSEKVRFHPSWVASKIG